MHNCKCKCNIIIICVSMCLCQSTCSSGQLVVLWPDAVSCRDIRIRIWSRWWSSSTWPLRPPRNTAAGKSTGNHSETKRRPVPACTQRHVLHGIKRQSSWTIQKIQRQHARMTLTMNINDNKSSQSHPGPTWQLPSHQLDYISDLSITLFNISLKHMHGILSDQLHSIKSALNVFACACAYRKSVVLYGVRYFAGPEDTGRTDHDLTRPQQHPLLPGHLKQAESNTHDVLIVWYTCSVCVWLYLWVLLHSLFYDASDAHQHCVFNLQKPLLDHSLKNIIQMWKCG